MRISIALLAVAVATLTYTPAFAQKAGQKLGQRDPATYDPISAMERSFGEWAKISQSVPEGERAEKIILHLLKRRPNESDEALAYRIYALLGNAENLSKASGQYGQMKDDGLGESHRWLYVARGSGVMYFVDLQTATISSQPRIWIQDFRSGVRLSSTLNEYDCEQRRARLLHVTTFKPDGSVQLSSETSDTTWSFISPGSINERLLKFSCS